jgi:hypothetical protein
VCVSLRGVIVKDGGVAFLVLMVPKRLPVWLVWDDAL